MGLFTEFTQEKTTLLNMVLVSREQRRAIFTYLLKEGVIVVKKDAYLPFHQHITNVPNLQVMMVVKSLKSKGCLNQAYNWGWSYYFLTTQGVTHLISELGLPSDSNILPATYTKKGKKIITAPTEGKGKGDEGEAAEEGETKGE